MNPILIGIVSAILLLVFELFDSEKNPIAIPLFGGLLIWFFNSIYFFFAYPLFTHWTNYVTFITVNASILVIYSGIANYLKRKTNNATTSFFGTVAVIGGVILLLSSLFFVAPTICNDSQIKQKAQLWHIQDATESFHDTDLTNLLRVSPEYATTKAKSVMPSSLGSYLEVSVPTLQLVNGHPYYIVGLKVREGQWSAFTNRGKGIVPGYIVVDAVNKDTTAEFRDGYQLRYVDSDRFWLETELDRHFFYNFSKGTSWQYSDLHTLEVDDEWNPFYTATATKHVVGNTGNVVVAVVVVDPQTGEITSYPIEEAPEWIDVIWNKTLITNYAEYWGNFNNAVICNPFDTSSGRKNVDKVNDVFAGDGELWYQVTFTSKGTDTSISEIVYVNPKTGEAIRYDVEGLGFQTIEQVDDLMDSASTRLKTEGFEPVEVEIQTILGEFVYYGILNSRGGTSAGSYGGVAFVLANDATEETEVIVASTLQEAYILLQQKIASKRSDDISLSDDVQYHQVTGILIVKSEWQGMYQLEVHDDSGVVWYFQAPMTDRAASHSQEGNQLTIVSYEGNRDEWINAVNIYIHGNPMFEAP